MANKKLGFTQQWTFGARCAAFSGEGVRTNKILVKTNGDVWVWDSVAGHYTNCHSLSESQQARLRNEARKLQHGYQTGRV